MQAATQPTSATCCTKTRPGWHFFDDTGTESAILSRLNATLGMESLDRFVLGEPLYRVHECVFGVLALESEPVDPRL